MGPSVSTMHPEGFHGARRVRRAMVGRPSRGSFFEGWYVKLISADRTARLALIPGVFLSEDGKTQEAFVQVLDGESGETAYHRFEIAQFAAAERAFDVRVGSNRFTSTGARVELPELVGEVRFGPFEHWPVTPRSPGAMGWYAWVPSMECYHGVVSLGHDLTGALEYKGRHVDLAGGRGYIESDWGTAFPQAYIWMQSNHFELPGASLVASTALIPWRRAAFRGDLVGLHLPAEAGAAAGLHRFTTYTRSRTLDLALTDDEVHWVMRSAKGWGLTLDATTRGRGAGLLHAPVRTQMHQRVAETLGGRIRVRLTDPGGAVAFEGLGRAAGIEVHGALDRLLATPGR
jgi:tocopherol cyclase